VLDKKSRKVILDRGDDMLWESVEHEG
jgi:hypothetical protein